MLLYGQKTHLPFCVLYSRLCPKLLVTGQVCPAATVAASMDQLTVGEREVDVEASAISGLHRENLSQNRTEPQQR